MAVRADAWRAPGASRPTSSCTARTRTSRCACDWRASARRDRAGCARRPRVRLREGRGQVAAARAQPLGARPAHLPGARCWRWSRPRSRPRSWPCWRSLPRADGAARSCWRTSTCCARFRACCASGARSRQRARSVRASSPDRLTPDLDSEYLGRAGQQPRAADGAAGLLAGGTGAAALSRRPATRGRPHARPRTRRRPRAGRSAAPPAVRAPRAPSERLPRGPAARSPAPAPWSLPTAARSRSRSAAAAAARRRTRP